MAKTLEKLESVVVRFVGDSGDGMQLTGTQFTETTALAGNDLVTFPDYPAEIRAPTGTVAGVSGFQIRFSSSEVLTPGDQPDVLVAMNPAALRVNLPDLKLGGIVLINTGAFDKRSVEKAGYKVDPREDGSLSAYRVFPIDISGQTVRAVEDVGAHRRIAERAKNFYALGLVYWLFNRSIEYTIEWIEKKFTKIDPLVAQANLAALQAGYSFGETAEMFTHSYVIPPATIAPGRYTHLSGNEATAYGLLAASELSGLELFVGSYPITPASDILHVLSGQKHLGAKTFQAEDEIAAMASTIGAAYAGALAATTTSGPGLALKSEGMSLALMLELPIVIVNVQRGGPSTGLPTKTEQADLLQAVYGRHGEAPIPVIAASSSGDCFWTAIEAARMAIRHMTPVIMLTDGYLANGAEPFRIPDISKIEKIPVKFATEAAGFLPYKRDDVLSRPWALPGTPGMEHRIGGLEKQHETGAVSYDGMNHEKMIRIRAEKVARIADDYAPTEVYGDPSGHLVLVSWGSTFGSVRAGVNTMRARGHKVGHVHLRHLNPLPKDLDGVLRRYERVIVPELNLGQLATLLRANLLIDARSLVKMQGKPFRESEIVDAIVEA